MYVPAAIQYLSHVARRHTPQLQASACLSMPATTTTTTYDYIRLRLNLVGAGVSAAAAAAHQPARAADPWSRTRRDGMYLAYETPSPISDSDHIGPIVVAGHCTDWHGIGP